MKQDPHADLAAALRALRASSGRKAESVARRALMSPAKLSKIENGRIVPSLTDVERLLAALDISGTAKEEFLRNVRAATTESTAWSTLRRAGSWRHQHAIAALEAHATEIRVFQGQLIPGLLQTPEYTSAVFDVPPVHPPEAKARTLAVRLDRQRSLQDISKSFSFVITEAAVRWGICPWTTMAMQMDRLASISRLPNVSIGLLPLDAPMPDFPMNCFTVYDLHLVTVETFHAQIDTSEPSNVALYRDVFERFSEAAVYGSQMVDILTRLRDDFLSRLGI